MVFSGLKFIPSLPHLELIFLNLSHNEIESLRVHTQTTLQVVDLSHNHIDTITSEAFAKYENLRELNISHNNLHVISQDAFVLTPMLQLVDMSNNDLQSYPLSLFRSQTELRRVHGDTLVICCLAKLASSVLEVCTPDDLISSCEDLIGQRYIRVLIWMQAIIAVIGNVYVLVTRVKDYKKKKSESSNMNVFFVGVLAVADMMMGFYLFVIAIFDQIYSQQFYIHFSAWRNGVVCKFAGVLSLIAAEASVFTLLVITITRTLSVVKPYLNLTTSPAKFRLCLGGFWALAEALSILPLFVTDSFFADSSLCLPTIYTNLNENSWRYTLFLMLLNFICFVTMLVLYVALFRAASWNRFQREGNSRTTSNNRRRLGRRVFLIVATDFLCWVPVCTTAFIYLAQGNKVLVDETFWYPFAAVVLMPINSAMNPVIYTVLPRFTCIHSRQNTSKPTQQSSSSAQK